MSLSSSDLHEIAQVKYRYAWSIDSRDWDQHRSLLADEITVDFGGIGHTGPPRRTTGDAWLAKVRHRIECFTMTQHVISNPVIREEDDGVRLTTYLVAQHAIDEKLPTSRLYTLGGFYDDRLSRTDGRWRLSTVALHARWFSGDESVWTTAMAVAPARH